MNFVYIVVSNWIVGGPDYDLSAEILEAFSKKQDAIDFANEYKKQRKKQQQHREPDYFHSVEVIEKELK